MTENEKAILTIISSAGDSKSKAFEALKKCETSDYAGARALMEEARIADVEAHKKQTEMITAEMSGNQADKEAISLLMVHAQDHYMSSQLARDLIEILIDVFESKEKGEKK